MFSSISLSELPNISKRTTLINEILLYFQDAGYSIKCFHMIKLSEFIILTKRNLIFLAVTSNVANRVLMRRASNTNYRPWHKSQILKKSQLFIKLPFICVNSLTLVERRNKNFLKLKHLFWYHLNSAARHSHTTPTSHPQATFMFVIVCHGVLSWPNWVELTRILIHLIFNMLL